MTGFFPSQIPLLVNLDMDGHSLTYMATSFVTAGSRAEQGTFVRDKGGTEQKGDHSNEDGGKGQRHLSH